MFQICSWNVRSLNDPIKRSLVKSVVSKLKTSVLCFQESKVDDVSRSFLRSFAGSFVDKCHLIKEVGASGGIITCWCAKDFSCSEVIVRNYSLTTHLKHVSNGTHFFLTNVYGPPTWDGKEEFFSELAALKNVCSGLWVMCGDFSLTRYQQKKRGRNWSRKIRTLFSNMINDLELIDLPMGNQNYTWSNIQCNPTLAKLDRFLISTDWDQTFPLTRVLALPRITSDHSPILLSTNDRKLGCLFRFEEVWLSRDDFCILAPIWWSEVWPKSTSVLTFVAKLRHCRKRIKEWCSTHFYNITKQRRSFLTKYKSWTFWKRVKI